MTRLQRNVFLAAVLLMVSITTAVVAWYGNLNFGWKNQSSWAFFSQEQSSCEIREVGVWTANQTLFDGYYYGPSIKKFSWLNIYVAKKDCYGNYDWLYLFADLTQPPANKNDTYTPEAFAQNGELRASVKMNGSDGELHTVNIKMSLNGSDFPSLYTYSGGYWSYIDVYGPATAVADLSVDSKRVLKDALSEPGSAYNDDSTYVE